MTVADDESNSNSIPVSTGTMNLRIVAQHERSNEPNNAAAMSKSDSCACSMYCSCLNCLRQKTSCDCGSADCANKAAPNSSSVSTINKSNHHLHGLHNSTTASTSNFSGSKSNLPCLPVSTKCSTIVSSPSNASATAMNTAISVTSNFPHPLSWLQQNQHVSSPLVTIPSPHSSPANLKVSVPSPTGRLSTAPSPRRSISSMPVTSCQGPCCAPPSRTNGRMIIPSDDELMAFSALLYRTLQNKQALMHMFTCGCLQQHLEHRTQIAEKLKLNRSTSSYRASSPSVDPASSAQSSPAPTPTNRNKRSSPHSGSNIAAPSESKKRKAVKQSSPENLSSSPLSAASLPTVSVTPISLSRATTEPRSVNVNKSSNVRNSRKGEVHQRNLFTSDHSTAPQQNSSVPLILSELNHDANLSLSVMDHSSPLLSMSSLPSSINDLSLPLDDENDELMKKSNALAPRKRRDSTQLLAESDDVTLTHDFLADAPAEVTVRTAVITPRGFNDPVSPASFVSDETQSAISSPVMSVTDSSIDHEESPLSQSPVFQSSRTAWPSSIGMGMEIDDIGLSICL